MFQRLEGKVQSYLKPRRGGGSKTRSRTRILKKRFREKFLMERPGLNE